MSVLWSALHMAIALVVAANAVTQLGQELVVNGGCEAVSGGWILQAGCTIQTHYFLGVLRNRVGSFSCRDYREDSLESVMYQFIDVSDQAAAIDAFERVVDVSVLVGGESSFLNEASMTVGFYPDNNLASAPIAKSETVVLGPVTVFERNQISEVLPRNESRICVWSGTRFIKVTIGMKGMDSHFDEASVIMYETDYCFSRTQYTPSNNITQSAELLHTRSPTFVSTPTATASREVTVTSPPVPPPTPSATQSRSPPATLSKSISHVTSVSVSQSYFGNSTTATYATPSQTTTFQQSVTMSVSVLGSVTETILLTSSLTVVTTSEEMITTTEPTPPPTHSRSTTHTETVTETISLPRQYLPCTQFPFSVEPNPIFDRHLKGEPQQDGGASESVVLIFGLPASYGYNWTENSPRAIEIWATQARAFSGFKDVIAAKVRHWSIAHNGSNSKELYLQITLPTDSGYYIEDDEVLHFRVVGELIDEESFCSIGPDHIKQTVVIHTTTLVSSRFAAVGYFGMSAGALAAIGGSVVGVTQLQLATIMALSPGCSSAADDKLAIASRYVLSPFIDLSRVNLLLCSLGAVYLFTCLHFGITLAVGKRLGGGKETNWAFTRFPHFSIVVAIIFYPSIVFMSFRILVENTFDTSALVALLGVAFGVGVPTLVSRFVERSDSQFVRQWAPKKDRKQILLPDFETELAQVEEEEQLSETEDGEGSGKLSPRRPKDFWTRNKQQEERTKESRSPSPRRHGSSPSRKKRSVAYCPSLQSIDPNMLPPTPFERLFIPCGRWEPRWVRRAYGVVQYPVAGSSKHWALLPLLLSAAVGILYAWTPEERGHCLAQCIVTACLFFLVAVAIAVRRPYVTQCYNGLAVLSMLSMTLYNIGRCLGLDSQLRNASTTVRLVAMIMLSSCCVLCAVYELLLAFYPGLPAQKATTYFGRQRVQRAVDEIDSQRRQSEQKAHSERLAEERRREEEMEQRRAVEEAQRERQQQEELARERGRLQVPLLDPEGKDKSKNGKGSSQRNAFDYLTYDPDDPTPYSHKSLLRHPAAQQAVQFQAQQPPVPFSPLFSFDATPQRGQFRQQENAGYPFPSFDIAPADDGRGLWINGDYFVDEDLL